MPRTVGLVAAGLAAAAFGFLCGSDSNAARAQSVDELLVGNDVVWGVNTPGLNSGVSAQAYEVYEYQFADPVLKVCSADPRLDSIAQTALGVWSEDYRNTVSFVFLGRCGQGMKPNNGISEVGFWDAASGVDKEAVFGRTTANGAAVTGAALLGWPSSKRAGQVTYMYEGDVMLLSWESVGPWALELVIHEFGHILGLGHSDDPKDIMYYSVSPGKRLSSTDRTNLAKKYPRALPQAIGFQPVVLKPNEVQGVGLAAEASVIYEWNGTRWSRFSAKIAKYFSSLKLVSGPTYLGFFEKVP